MEFKILKQEKNPFLCREEFLIDVHSESNPSFNDVKNFIKRDEELVVIKKIKGGFGSNIFKAEVYVYDSKDARDKIETIPKKTKKKREEKIEEKKEEAKEAHKKEEKSENLGNK